MANSFSLAPGERLMMATVAFRRGKTGDESFSSVKDALAAIELPAVVTGRRGECWKGRWARPLMDGRDATNLLFPCASTRELNSWEMRYWQLEGSITLTQTGEAVMQNIYTPFPGESEERSFMGMAILARAEGLPVVWDAGGYEVVCPPGEASTAWLKGRLKVRRHFPFNSDELARADERDLEEENRGH